MTSLNWGLNSITFNEQEAELLQIMLNEAARSPEKMKKTHLSFYGHQKNQERAAKFVTTVNENSLNDHFENVSIQFNGMYRCPVICDSILRNLKIKKLQITDNVN